jgi:hypothetical protein
MFLLPIADLSVANMCQMPYHPLHEPLRPLSPDKLSNEIILTRCLDGCRI